jgi:hypothetical protein
MLPRLITAIHYIRSAASPADALSRGSKTYDQQPLVVALKALDLAVALGSKNYSVQLPYLLVKCLLIPVTSCGTCR